jgi:hypothetical protein
MLPPPGREVVDHHRVVLARFLVRLSHADRRGDGQTRTTLGSGRCQILVTPMEIGSPSRSAFVSPVSNKSDNAKVGSVISAANGST